MSDEIKDFQIKIVTAADLKAAQASAKALQDVGQAASSTASEQAKGGEAAQDAHEKGGQAAAKHALSHKALHKVVHALNEVVPGLGVVMQAAFNPVGATVSVAVMALGYFHEHLKRVNEELDKMAEENAKPLTNRLEIMREAVIRNAGSMVELGLRLQSAARSEKDLAKSIDEVISQMHRQAEQVQALSEVRGKNELAVLENLHKAGLVSEEDYARRRIEIEEEVAKRKRKLAEDELQYEINIKKEGEQAARQQQPELNKEAESARKKSEQTKTDALVAKGGMETAKENAKTAAEALKTWEKEHERDIPGRDMLNTFQTAGPKATGKEVAATMYPGKLNESTPEFREAEKKFEEWQTLKLTADKTKKVADKAPTEVARKETAAATAEEEYKHASDRAVKNAELAKSLQQEGELKQRELEMRKGLNAELSKAEHGEHQVAGPRGQIATQDLQQAVKTALHFADTPEMYRARNPGTTPQAAQQAVAAERHAPVSGQDVQQMTDLAGRITGHKTGLDEAVKVLGRAAQDTGAFTEDVGKLVEVMENLTKNLGPIRGRIDQLESQVRSMEGRPNRL